MSLDPSGRTFETGALMLALAGYTLLLGTTACVMIRLGGIWDDARTILLLIVAMFLAISITFDETLAGNPSLGRACFLGGLIFAVLVSEALLRIIRLRLPLFYRLPYYLILALFFLYPVLLSSWIRDPESATLQWALFGFSPLAGIAFLALIPAIRRGAGYLAKNGSPWPYPLYPWTLFGLLAVAVCARASYLCVSFHFVGKSNTIFGPYFLVPFLLAMEVLLVEAALVSRNEVMQRVDVGAPRRAHPGDGRPPRRPRFPGVSEHVQPGPGRFSPLPVADRGLRALWLRGNSTCTAGSGRAGVGALGPGVCRPRHL
jgi:hypothetical protein